MGFGNGPLIAAGLMAGGAALLVGWGLTQLATSDGGFTQALQGNHAPTEAPGNPAEQNAGGSSAQQPSEAGTGKPDESGASPSSKPGRGSQDEDEDEPNGSGAPSAPAPKTKPRTIVPGDTLAEISRRTGVPIGVLVEANKIQNSDLTEWASRLIPRA
ncbi:LysM peptidoglycan-binding domain-containing protein [Streptomyces sp. NPDC085524]|uniref:LysM peptidoglycan-binding domain-containing protein n=1 Tax=unclassified Streptomyces TaxID=2593676 RepID=UPI0035E2B8CF